MTFIWPELLWLLVLVPLAVGAYLWMLRRKRRAAVRYAGLAMVREAMGVGDRVRRHLPPALFLAALTLMLAAVARPAAVVTLPSQHETVILAMDVSISMRAVDVEPNRLAAAQAAARTFVSEQPRSARIGVVAFAGTASLVQSPTREREDVLAAIDRFQTQRGTAVGSAILVSLATIFPDAGIDADTVPPSGRGGAGGRERGGGGGGGAGAGAAGTPLGQSLDRTPKGGNDAQPFKPVPPGSYQNAVIILLTDGQTTTGPNPIDAARMAAERGVRVFTVGVGTAGGDVLRGEGWSIRVSLDEDALKSIADMTRGEYFYAGTATDLKKVYQTLNSKLVLEKKETEITALFAAVAAGLMLLSAMLSMMWFNRVF